MPVQTLRGITLLLLLCQHVGFLSASTKTSTKKLVVCEGHSASLSCDNGLIHVLAANYGRTNCKTCSAGRRPAQLLNTKCVEKESLYKMTVRCNGRKNCSVPAQNRVFSDPCYGTYKYLQVSYECRSLMQSITCEGAKSVISCEKGVLSIHHANYGRRDLALCPHKLGTSPQCYSPQTASICSRCCKKKSCNLDASNAVFSDPCFGNYKYLEVTYYCL
ncbi:L-rhamnose-binding lectin CSL3-like [Puntigrus tetrazona]|uniref:L-rhamnose-binding lectin CSL3-like n=1 Tax=Puntigrus tetrazona TaxID=1606681 RepID=UPI001C894B9F|nr:L-rhamnose-binding lectin CSL3-like [Puntigrus tetrazona]